MVQRNLGQFYLLLAVAVFLNLFDLLSTLIWCQTLGSNQELNPLLRYLFSISPFAGIAFKAAAIGVFVGLIKYGSNFNFRLAYQGALLVVYIYSALAGWHILGPLLHV
jgi:hypothetical protein